MFAEVVDSVPSMTGLGQVSQSPKGRLSAPLNPNAHALSAREIRFSWFPPPGKPLGYKVSGGCLLGEGVERAHHLWPPPSLRDHCWVDAEFAEKIPAGFISLSITYHEMPRLFWTLISEEWHNMLVVPEQI